VTRGEMVRGAGNRGSVARGTRWMRSTTGGLAFASVAVATTLLVVTAWLHHSVAVALAEGATDVASEASARARWASPTASTSANEALDACERERAEVTRRLEVETMHAAKLVAHAEALMDESRGESGANDRRSNGKGRGNRDGDDEVERLRERLKERDATIASLEARLEAAREATGREGTGERATRDPTDG
jgi:predicted RNase H-like nuclease (RuvC/YqgF family)